MLASVVDVVVTVLFACGLGGVVGGTLGWVLLSGRSRQTSPSGERPVTSVDWEEEQ